MKSDFQKNFQNIYLSRIFSEWTSVLNSNLTIKTQFNNPEKFIQLELEPTEFNWISFYQFYSFILSKISLNLFPYLYSQSRINELNSIKKYTLSSILEAQNINYESFRISLSELENLKLLSIFSNLTEDGLVIRLLSPLPIRELIESKKFTGEKIPKFKLTELQYSLEKYSDLQELTFRKEQKEKNIELDNLKPEERQLYWAFYDELYKNSEREFILSAEIIKLIKDYWESEKISSTKLIDLASLSLRINKKGKYYLSITELSNLIEEELGLSKKEFKLEEYHSFWQRLHSYKDKKELKKEFKALFSIYTNISFYLKLTRKKQIPAKLEHWIQDCIQKNIDPLIINGMLSFVHSLLKKIPINYLAKMTENFINDGINTLDQFLAHLSSVLKYELTKGKNRLGIVENIELKR